MKLVPVILKRPLPTGRGKERILAGARVKLKAQDAAHLVAAGAAELCDGSKCYKKPGKAKKPTKTKTTPPKASEK